MTVASAVEALHEQLYAPNSEPSFFVAASGTYSEANMRRFNEAKIRWISRVPAHEHRGQGRGENGSQDAVAQLGGWTDPTSSHKRCRCLKGKSGGWTCTAISSALSIMLAVGVPAQKRFPPCNGTSRRR